MVKFSQRYVDLNQEAGRQMGFYADEGFDEACAVNSGGVEKSMASLRREATFQFLLTQAGYLCFSGAMMMLGAITLADAQVSDALSHASRLCGAHLAAGPELLGHCPACWLGAAELAISAMLAAFSIRRCVAAAMPNRT